MTTTVAARQGTHDSQVGDDLVQARPHVAGLGHHAGSQGRVRQDALRHRVPGRGMPRPAARSVGRAETRRRDASVDRRGHPRTGTSSSERHHRPTSATRPPARILTVAALGFRLPRSGPASARLRRVGDDDDTLVLVGHRFGSGTASCAGSGPDHGRRFDGQRREQWAPAPAGARRGLPTAPASRASR